MNLYFVCLERLKDNSLELVYQLAQALTLAFNELKRITVGIVLCGQQWLDEWLAHPLCNGASAAVLGRQAERRSGPGHTSQKTRVQMSHVQLAALDVKLAAKLAVEARKLGHG